MTFDFNEVSELHALNWSSGAFHSLGAIYEKILIK